LVFDVGFDDVERGAARGANEETGGPDGALVLAPEKRPELIEERRGRLILKASNVGRRVALATRFRAVQESDLIASVTNAISSSGAILLNRSR
jgi:hypothetical protein